jgi:UDP-glucose 4-epimerase
MLAPSGSDSFEVYNLGTGEGVSVLELVKKFIAVTGVSLPYEIGPRRPGDVEKTYADPSLAFARLGWKTRRSMEDALKDAWNWQKKISGIA